MEFLAQLGVAAVELFEAEGRALRRSLVRLAVALGFGLVLLLLALTGLGFLLYGVFLMLSQLTSPADAAVIMGLAALIFSALGVWIIRKMF